MGSNQQPGEHQGLGEHQGPDEHQWLGEHQQPGENREPGGSHGKGEYRVKSERRAISVSLLDTAARSIEPVKELLRHADGFIETRDYDGVDVIDNLLMSVLVRLLRAGSKAALDSSVMELLAFIETLDDDARNDERLRWFMDRWKHTYQILDRAAGKYDHQYAGRFIKSKKFGQRLMLALRNNPDGLTVSELAKELDNMAVPQLSRLLAEFDDFDLIEKSRDGTRVTARLSVLGRVYMEKESPPLAQKESPPMAQKDETPTPQMMPQVSMASPKRYNIVVAMTTMKAHLAHCMHAAVV